MAIYWICVSGTDDETEKELKKIARFLPWTSSEMPILFSETEKQ